MKLRMLIFLGTVLLVLGLACFYMARRSMALHPPLQHHQLLVWGMVLTFLLLQIGVPLLHRLTGLRFTALHAVSYMALSLVSTFFLYLAGADLIQTILRTWGGASPRLGSWALAVAAALTAASCGIGLVQCYLPIRIRRIDVPIPGLPAGLAGYRIAQISDLHLGPMLQARRVAHVVARTNGLSPDLIAVTGDLADGDVEQERKCLAALEALRAPDGIMFVTGNHEYYSGADPWLAAVGRMGWQALQNEHRVLRRGDAALAVIGLPDPTSRSVPELEGPDLDKAMKGVPADAVKVLLYHPPTGADRANRAGIHLQLSGHTHGGQYFPWSLVVRLFFDHPLGLDRHEGLWIYTSPGTGFWGPPNRFLVPPEITLLTFQAAPEAQGR